LKQWSIRLSEAFSLSRAVFGIDNMQACRYNDFCQAGVAQLVEYKLPKLGVVGSNPVARSISYEKSAEILIAEGQMSWEK
jgi:hypothetical protein